MYNFFQERTAGDLSGNAVPAGAARFPPPSRGGGRAQTAAPSGLWEKGRRISGISVPKIAPDPCIPVSLNALPCLIWQHAPPRAQTLHPRPHIFNDLPCLTWQNAPGIPSETSMPRTAETEAEFPFLQENQKKLPASTPKLPAS